MHREVHIGEVDLELEFVPQGPNTDTYDVSCSLRGSWVV